jgi:hypothetical protein
LEQRCEKETSLKFHVEHAKAEKRTLAYSTCFLSLYIIAAGDYVKFGFPFASAMTVLSWGYLTFAVCTGYSICALSKNYTVQDD